MVYSCGASKLATYSRVQPSTSNNDLERAAECKETVVLTQYQNVIDLSHNKLNLASADLALL